MVNYTSQKMISMVSLITRKTPKYIQGHNLSDNRVIVNSWGVLTYMKAMPGDLLQSGIGPCKLQFLRLLIQPTNKPLRYLKKQICIFFIFF